MDIAQNPWAQDAVIPVPGGPVGGHAEKHRRSVRRHPPEKLAGVIALALERTTADNDAVRTMTAGPMPRSRALLGFLVPLLPTLVAGCGGVDVSRRALMDPRSLFDPHPGLEQAQSAPSLSPPASPSPPPGPASVPSLERPQSSPDDPLPFPAVAQVSGPQAVRELEGDPLALRFLIVRQLLDERLISPSEAAVRVDANKGALLPLTAPQPPAVGLDRPLPPVDAILARFRALDAARDAADGERSFLLDAILPAAPAARRPLTPPDLASARALLARLDRLEETGLIGADERFREKRAVEALVDSGKLPDKAAVPTPSPPPATEAKAAPGHRPHHGFEPEIAPSPPGMDPPKLAPGAKGPAGAYLLAMASPAFGDKAWTVLAQQNPELAGLSHKLVKADLGNLGVTYRLIAGPVDPAAADKLCGALRARNQDCLPTPFPP
ncbi:MAG: hypothetical protein M0006_00550 [Magnetospirillum sp.]|nr:hypothetical protein [Magnetospirillum sp.]